MKKAIRDLIIGKTTYIESWTEYRQVMLSGQINLMAIIFAITYLAIDLARGGFSTTPVYFFVIGSLVIPLYLHRKGDHCTANYFLFPILNFAVYLFTSSESSYTGAALLYIPIALGAFAVFNYKQRTVAISFAVVTYLLFMVTYLLDFSILPKRIYNETELLWNLVINFSVVLPSSILAIYLLISLNHHNARALVKSNAMLTKSNEELDRFVYSTSHDLRAPLASVLGLIAISDKVESMDEIKRYLSMMKARVNSLDSFIKDITDYSRNNRLQITFSSVNLFQLTNEIWESLRYTPGSEEITFTMNVPEDFEIQTDSTRLQTVLSNLLSNAIRYHDNRKEKKFIHLSCYQTDQSFSLSIEDNGQGIPPEYQKRIFDMFFRANESSQGSGLGLYIVKETITKLSGSVQLQSVPREGSTFTINLPRL